MTSLPVSYVESRQSAITRLPLLRCRPGCQHGKRADGTPDTAPDASCMTGCLRNKLTVQAGMAAQAYLERAGCFSGRLDGLAVDDGQQRGVHGLPQRGVEAVVRAALRSVADRVPGTAQQSPQSGSGHQFWLLRNRRRTCGGSSPSSLPSTREAGPMVIEASKPSVQSMEQRKGGSGTCRATFGDKPGQLCGRPGCLSAWPASPSTGISCCPSPSAQAAVFGPMDHRMREDAAHITA